MKYFACLLLISCSAACADERPNVVVIMADDLGYGDLSCYGATDLRTPHVDALAARGIRFTHFYANSPVCSPTRAALLTGCYPDTVGVPGVIRTRPDDNFGYLRPDTVLLPQLLRDAGYRTAIVGKWHLGLTSPNTPNERGFEHFHGFLGDMMDDYFKHRRHDINYMRLNAEEIDPSGHATELFTEWACEFLREQNGETPFFLYLAYNAPHTPLQPADDWLARVRDREPQLDDKRAKLVALVEHMDDGVGRVFETLETAGHAENTLVVFTSDNGGQINAGATNGPLRDGKGTMYEGGIRVPMIAAWPGRIRDGGDTAFSAMTMDLFATALQAAGIKGPENVDGRSILPTLRGDAQETLRQDWFFVRREGGVAFGGKTIDAVRRGDWKLLQNSPIGPRELYNLADDPAEQHDLVEEHPAVVAELSAALRRHIQRAGRVPWQPPQK